MRAARDRCAAGSESTVCCETVTVGTRLPPDETGTGEHLHLPADPTSARAARRFVDEHCPPEVRDIATLLTSEVVTNAVLHAATPLTLGIRVHRRSVLIGVTDSNTLSPRPTLAHTQREGGRGLALVDALADRWGCEEQPEGKTVWFLLERRR